MGVGGKVQSGGGGGGGGGGRGRGVLVHEGHGQKKEQCLQLFRLKDIKRGFQEEDLHTQSQRQCGTELARQQTKQKATDTRCGSLNSVSLH